MSKLNKLRGKRERRVKSRKHHYAEYSRHKKKGRKHRARWHLIRFRWDKRAAKKLNRLISKQIKRQKASRRIDWNGCQPVGGPNLRKVIRYALHHYDVYITSTNGGTHTPTSYHYRKQAVDIGADSAQAKTRCQHGLYKKFGAGMFAELFGPDNYPWVKNGATYTTPEGTALETLHDTHVHVAVTS